MDKITNLPDAIRIGSLTTRQCRLVYGKLGFACAWGAAIVATVPGGIEQWECFNLSEQTEWLKRLNMDLIDVSRLSSFVFDCNDRRMLTREQIAAILAAREWKEYGSAFPQANLPG